ncbi:hypothetical protein DESC_350063 [Desulfosarcina cetonica]|nr:hypothetical protein DESC_350063 [Desulfosarcina cetonica]
MQLICRGGIKIAEQFEIQGVLVLLLLGHTKVLCHAHPPGGAKVSIFFTAWKGLRDGLRLSRRRAWVLPRPAGNTDPMKLVAHGRQIERLEQPAVDDCRGIGPVIIDRADGLPGHDDNGRVRLLAFNLQCELIAVDAGQVIAGHHDAEVLFGQKPERIHDIPGSGNLKSQKDSHFRHPCQGCGIRVNDQHAAGNAGACRPAEVGHRRPAGRRFGTWDL